MQLFHHAPSIKQAHEGRDNGVVVDVGERPRIERVPRRTLLSVVAHDRVDAAVDVGDPENQQLELLLSLDDHARRVGNRADLRLELTGLLAGSTLQVGGSAGS